MTKAEKKTAARKTIKAVKIGDRVQIDFRDRYEHNQRSGSVVEIMQLIPGRPQLYAVRLDDRTTVDCPPWAVAKVAW